MTRQVRRVVTGKNAEGKSVFVSDDLVDPITVAIAPGSAFHVLWGGDQTPALPADGTEPAHPAYFPPPGGYRFGFFTVPPAGGALPADPGMHTTNTVDFEVVLSGQVVCELDDGASVTLGSGDTFVQNGTRHRWSNPGTEPAFLFVALIGAQPPSLP